MPFIRVNCPKGALTAEQKAMLLAGARPDPSGDRSGHRNRHGGNRLILQRARRRTAFPGGVPRSQHPDRMFWTVEAFVAASYFSQPRRDEMQQDIAAAFVDILGDDETVLEREDIRIAPCIWLHAVACDRR